MSDFPNTASRHLLARLDQTIINANERVEGLKELAKQVSGAAGALGTEVAYLKALRAELRPTLDPSAPSDFPYDKKR